MNKNEFLGKLGKALSGLPQSDIDERLSFYAEMIDDRVEEGLTEEEAVSEIGSADDIASQIIADTPFSKIVKEKIKPKRELKGWEIVLLILGFPLWFPLLIAAAAVVFSLYIVLWALIVSLWAVWISFVVASAACFVNAVVFFKTGQALPALALIGAGVLVLGLSIFLFFGCTAATKGAARLTKKIALLIKSSFVGKEKKNEQK
ncbi:MAG: DUF1700 domain-containing protein [Clostridia bacterium]|nr:DUF1700 domain-containing protein [Clostridia bacterium]